MKPVSVFGAVVAALLLPSNVTIASAQPAAHPAAPAAAAAAAPGAAAPVTWEVFSGYKRFSGNCQVCHGTDALGGTFAPNLTNSLKTLTHDQFLETVVNGKQNAELAMPSFGSDPNVMCYIEDIYAYLKARAGGTLGRGRPDPQPKKPAEVAANEASCMGS